MVETAGIEPCAKPTPSTILSLCVLLENQMNIKRSCEYCKKPFTTRVADVNRGYGRFCSRSCSNRVVLRKSHAPNCTCAWCGKKFFRYPSKQASSRSGLLFCNRRCKEQAQRIGGLEEIQPDHYDNGKSERHYRELAARRLPPICNRCGYDKHPEILEVHHKDRNRKNNALENLERVCPNCHTLEHNGNGGE